MKMSTREAYETVIKSELEELANERGWDFGHIGDIVDQISGDSTFHNQLTDFFEEHLEIFGENYGIEF